MCKFFRNTSLIVFLGCFLITWSHGPTAWGQTIFAILAADTADTKIGNAVKTDMDNMARLLQGNVPATNLNIITLDANAMTPDGILRSVENLTVAPNDAILFYYSGHGAFDTSGDKQFLALTRGGNLYRDTLLAKISEKKPRLTVLLTDCCNNTVNNAGARSLSTTAPQSVRSPESFSPLFENLLLYCRGTVDLTSSKPGEYSFTYDATRGSIFTMAFIEMVTHNRTSSDMYWNEFYEKLSVRTQEIFREKLPNGFKAPGQDTTPAQMAQTVHKYRLPGEETIPSAEGATQQGPRLGLRAASHDGIGVRITAIAPNSPAARVGFLVGEIITEINGKEVRNEDNYSEAVDASPQTMVLTVQRTDGSSRNVTVELGW